MAFHVIFVAPGLNDPDTERAVVAGPPHAAASGSYCDLLAVAGFDEIAEIDLTNDYRQTAAAWLYESAKAAEQLQEIFGFEEFRQRQQDREEALAAIEGGLLRRSLFSARAG